MENKDQNLDQTGDRLSSSLKLHPLKDGILLLSALAIIGLIFLISFYSRPKNDKSTLFVQIKYQNTLLFDPSDPSKSTHIAFPEEGEKKIRFTQKDGPLFLGEGNEFVFQGEAIAFTLYSDYSIQVLHDDVHCKDYDCARQGRIYNTYTPIVCLPNTRQARIISEKGGFPEFDD